MENCVPSESNTNPAHAGQYRRRVVESEPADRPVFPHSGHTHSLLPSRSTATAPPMSYQHFGHRFLPFARSHNNAHTSTQTPSAHSTHPVTIHTHSTCHHAVLPITPCYR